jgi:hypothetical protein
VITIARYDKYEGRVGGFRAPLNANFAYTASQPDFAHADLNKVFCVSLNANGRVVIGTPNNAGTMVGGLVGVLALDTPLAAGEIVDVMTSGEIVEFTLSNGAAAAAGTRYTSNADGSYGTTAIGSANGAIGYTVEATRLVVRVVQGAEA